MRPLQAELGKLSSLPATWIAMAVGIAVTAGVSVLSAGSAPSPDSGFSSLALGVAGAIVLGVVAMSHEYAVEGEESAGGRRITTTLVAIPSRVQVLIAKAVAVVLGTAVLAVASIIVAFGLLTVLNSAAMPAVDGDFFIRCAGVVAYWVLVALLAFSLTVIIRSGVVPMAVLIANFSAVPMTFLLTKVTPAANWLPDVAGMRMWSRGIDSSVQMSPGLGGLVMAAWIAVLLAISFVVFTRRDA